MPDEIFDRLPPSNLDAERAVLGACLLDREALVDVTEFLSPDDFYDLNYRDVFNVIMDMVKSSRPVDMLTLSAELQNRGLLEKLGGRRSSPPSSTACPRRPTPPITPASCATRPSTAA